LAIKYLAGDRLWGTNAERLALTIDTEVYSRATGESAQDLSETTYSRVGMKATSITAGNMNKLTAKIRVAGSGHDDAHIVYCRIRNSSGTIVAQAEKTIAQLTGGGTATEYAWTGFTGSGVTNGIVEIDDGFYCLLEYAYGDATNYLAVSFDNSGETGWSWVQYVESSSSYTTYTNWAMSYCIIGETTLPNLSNGTIFITSDTNVHYMWDGTDAWNTITY